VAVNVGVIGCGMIGQDHIRRLTRVLSGARVTAVADADPERARAVADGLVGAKVYGSGEELIDSVDVQAVLVTSWGPTHERYVLAGLAAGKPVFCEKPLASTADACSRIVNAEDALGRRLVQVGFMRRYDEAYRAMKATVDSGSIGAPLIMHAAHRNPTTAAHFTSDMIVNDTGVHDIDVARWMLDDEVAAVAIVRPRRNRKAVAGFADPLLMLLEMVSGAVVDVELSLNAGFGYDIRGEVVCEDGTVELSESAGVIVKASGAHGGRVPGTWQERFARAFDTEFQAWLDGVAAGADATGPSVWDGYAATVVCDAGLAALHSGSREPVVLRERPALYG
jgi:myo-inositol 2-dehydrogenase/D-chiro-inositol 1-dehydrogenase